MQQAQGTDLDPQHPTPLTQYHHNNLGQLDSLSNWYGGNSVSSFTGMRYDAAGNRLSMTSSLPQTGNAPDASRTLNYNYDNLDQLTGENSQSVLPTTTDPYGLNYNFGFGYDSMGNAQYFRSQGNLPFNGDNQLAASSFQYDGNGNPTTYSGLSGMIFDPENHLTSVPGMMQAGYDSEGLRAWKQGSSTQGPASPVYYLYDGDTAIVEEDINGSVLAWNGFGADGLRTRYTSNPVNGASQTQHYAFDPTGNLSNRLDPNGVASNSTVYDAFGALRGQINTATGQPEPYPDPVGFSGQWGGDTDPETKLVLLTHRFYDPSHGRWLNRDPIGYGGGLNLYGYCGNNPVTGVDPSGFATVWIHHAAPGAMTMERLETDQRQWQIISTIVGFTPYRPVVECINGMMTCVRLQHIFDEKGWPGVIAEFTPSSSTDYSLDIQEDLLGLQSIGTSMSTPALRPGVGVRVNQARGDEFRDRMVRFYRAHGWDTRIEQTHMTPHGPRRIDIELWKNGRLMRRIECKTGNSPYTRRQRMKDEWLRVNRGMPFTEVVRIP